MADYTGQRFGAYQLLQLLGQGSFADVYLGRHLTLKQEVAIKVLYGRLDKDAIEHFLTEAHHLRDLSHPHIVRIEEVGLQDGVPFLVMEYAPGGRLRMRHPRGASALAHRRLLRQADCPGTRLCPRPPAHPSRSQARKSLTGSGRSGSAL